MSARECKRTLKSAKEKIPPHGQLWSTEARSLIIILIGTSRLGVQCDQQDNHWLPLRSEMIPQFIPRYGLLKMSLAMVASNEVDNDAKITETVHFWLGGCAQSWTRRRGRLPAIIPSFYSRMLGYGIFMQPCLQMTCLSEIAHIKMLDTRTWIKRGWARLKMLEVLWQNGCEQKDAGSILKLWLWMCYFAPSCSSALFLDIEMGTYRGGSPTWCLTCSQPSGFLMQCCPACQFVCHVWNESVRQSSRLAMMWWVWPTLGRRCDICGAFPSLRINYHTSLSQARHSSSRIVPAVHSHPGTDWASPSYKGHAIRPPPSCFWDIKRNSDVQTCLDDSRLNEVAASGLSGQSDARTLAEGI